MKTAVSVEKPLHNPTAGALIYLKLVLTAIFWGGTFVAGRVIAREVEPFSAAFLRFLVASIFLTLFLWRSPEKTPRLAAVDGLLLLALGLTGVFAYNIFFFAGLKKVTASRASLIIACNPAFIALAAAWFFRERLKLVNVFGVGLSITGAVIVISQGNPAALLTGRVGLGELYIFGCVLSWVLYSILGKAAMKRLTPLTAVTFSCAIGAACLLPPACHGGLLRDFTRYSPAAWAGIVYLGFFGSALGFCWYYEGIKAIGPSRAGVFINFVPLSGVILAHLLLNEPITAVIVVGALFVVTGVYCTNRAR